MNKQHSRTLPMVLTILLVLVMVFSAFTVSGAFAALIDSTAKVRTELIPAKVSCEVSGEGENVTVKNTGNIPALIRAKIVVNWINTEDGTVAAAVPEGFSYELQNGTGWTKAGDYWYCSAIIPAGGTADGLIAGLTVTAPGGQYRLQVQVLAEAIQATPADAVAEAWGMTYVSGTWTGKE